MRLSQDKEYYLKYYINSLCFLGELQINTIRILAELKGQGAEYISCSFDPEDEDYKKGYVTLFFWKPADDEDTMIYVENYMFYKALLELCEKHMEKYIETKDKLYNYLNQIKKNLEI